MARIEGVADGKAGLISRGLFWLARRKLGRVSEMWRICAHAPRIQLGRGLLRVFLCQPAGFSEGACCLLPVAGKVMPR